MMFLLLYAIWRKSARGRNDVEECRGELCSPLQEWRVFLAAPCTYCNILLLKGKLSCIGKMWVLQYKYNHSDYVRKYGGDSYV